ncbi:Tyrosine-protein kinase Src42A [Halotydeus destructor]|nr:Tyrosine-protein kinase Src42A [Halotydeus destructor]
MGQCVSVPKNESAEGEDYVRSVSNEYVQEPIIPPHPRRNHHLLHQLERQMASTLRLHGSTYSVHTENAPVIRQQVICLYGYHARTSEDLTFRKGDILTIIDDSLGDWFLAINDSHLQGYVPSNYLARLDNGQITANWYFGKMSRSEATRHLDLDENPVGAFLIREAESRPGYALSMKDGTTVRHYRIKKTPNNLFYISPKTTFSCLDDLVHHYRTNMDGLSNVLTVACIQKTAPITNDLAYSVRDQWEIDRRTLTMTRKLGSGHFADVFQGLWNHTTPVAVKMLKNTNMSREEFLNEACIMKQFSHKNLVRLYAVCSIDEPILIVTELMINGSLLNYLKKGKGQELNEHQLIDMGAQVASGMAYLESHNYIHRDLAARNILVGQANQVKIADFGLARFTTENEIYEAREGTRFPIKWTSPEALRTGQFTTKSDVWSFGIVLYEIITKGQSPYQSLSNVETLRQLENGYRLPMPDECPKPFYDIMYTCWTREADLRPTLRDYSGNCKTTIPFTLAPAPSIGKRRPSSNLARQCSLIKDKTERDSVSRSSVISVPSKRIVKCD